MTDEPWLGVIERTEQKRYAEGKAGVTVAQHDHARGAQAVRRPFLTGKGVERAHLHWLEQHSLSLRGVVCPVVAAVRSRIVDAESVVPTGEIDGDTDA